MFLLIIYNLLIFGVWYSECIKQSYKGNKITFIPIQNRNKNITFVYNNYIKPSEFKNHNLFVTYNKKYNTPKLKIKPSIVFSKINDDNINEEKTNKYKELVDPKSTISRSSVKFSPIVSVASVSAYLLPFITATETFYKLLISLELPGVIQKLIKTSVKTSYAISSIPNLVDFLYFFLYSFLAKKKNLINNRFIKFNLAQGSIMFIYNNLLSKIYSYCIQPLGDGLVATSLGYTLLLSTFVPLIYCMACSLIGTYSQLPVISQAANLNVSNDSFKI